MVNAWMTHVKEVSKANAGKSLKEILKMAKKTYKKSPAAHKKAHKKSHKKSHKSLSPLLEICKGRGQPKGKARNIP